jgi:hypothetical protein
VIGYQGIWYLDLCRCLQLESLAIPPLELIKDLNTDRLDPGLSSSITATLLELDFHALMRSVEKDILDSSLESRLIY